MTTIEHLISCLGEEGAEIAQDCSKINRFGMFDTNCLIPDGPNNQERLIMELNDLLAVAEMLVANGLIPANWQCPIKQIAKMAKVHKFIEYARSVGTITD